MAFRLAKDGWREIVIAAMLLAGGACAIVWLCPWRWFAWAAAAAALAVWLGVLCFFRDPQRRIPHDEGLFVSPADGVVTDVTAVGPNSQLGREGMRVGVFMSVLNAHVNRAPCDGKIISLSYRPGRFLDARRPAARSENESLTIALDHQVGQRHYPVVVRQVAGMIARRIVCRMREGDQLHRGQRFGMIKFGSRLELFLPADLNADIRVAVGQKVLAGSSVVASVAARAGGGGDTSTATPATAEQDCDHA